VHKERRKQKVQQDDALAALDNWHGGHRRPRDVRCTCLRADYTFSDTDPDGESAYQVCLRDYFKTTLFLSWTAIILSLAVTVGPPVLLPAFLSGDARLGQHQVHQLLRSEQWQPVMLAYFVVSVMGLGLYLSRWSLCFWKALRRFRGHARAGMTTSRQLEVRGPAHIAFAERSARECDGTRGIDTKKKEWGELKALTDSIDPGGTHQFIESTPECMMAIGFPSFQWLAAR